MRDCEKKVAFLQDGRGDPSPTVFGDIPSRDLPSQSLCDSSPKGRAFIYKDFNNKPLTLGEVTAVRQAERG